jgi:hypothetical protein
MCIFTVEQANWKEGLRGWVDVSSYSGWECLAR